MRLVRQWRREWCTLCHRPVCWLDSLGHITGISIPWVCDAHEALIWRIAEA